MKKVLLSAAIISITALMPAKACDLHDGMMFGAFGMNHPLMQRHKQMPVAEAKLMLPEVSQSKTGAASELALDYSAPAIYDEVTLYVRGSDNIELLQGQEIALIDVSGIVNLKYLAKTPGKHNLEFEIKASVGGQTKSFVQLLTVEAI